MNKCKALLLAAALLTLLTSLACDLKTKTKSGSFEVQFNVVADNNNGKEVSNDSAQESGPRKAGDRMVKTVDGVQYAFRWCPPGTFMMGSPENEEHRLKGETQHEVTLTKGFWMLETEVTQAMWKSVMKGNPSRFTGNDKPVEKVSWDECQVFCKKLSDKTGLNITLPTEAQWEYACRAGSTGVFGGDKLDEISWHGGIWGGFHPVATKKPNAWGLYDMHGNVWEWCQDWYDDYPNEAVTDPTGPDNGNFRISRGGAWTFDPMFCRAAFRGRFKQNSHDNSQGFRIVFINEEQTDEEQTAEEQSE